MTRAISGAATMEKLSLSFLDTPILSQMLGSAWTVPWLHRLAWMAKFVYGRHRLVNFALQWKDPMKLWQVSQIRKGSALNESC